MEESWQTQIPLSPPHTSCTSENTSNENINTHSMASQSSTVPARDMHMPPTISRSTSGHFTDALISINRESSTPSECTAQNKKQR